MIGTTLAHSKFTAALGACWMGEVSRTDDKESPFVNLVVGWTVELGEER
jgi:hypothetical protein